MIDRFLLFVKMLLTGVFKFTAGAILYLAFIIGIFIVIEVITIVFFLVLRVKILSILLLIFLSVVIVITLFFIVDDFWSRYKRERDSRGL